MKKVTLPDELKLTKEIIASLTPEQLREIEGGGDYGYTVTSPTSCLAASCSVEHVIREAE